MTINDLEMMSAYLYKEAEEAIPIVGGADKKDWIARRIDEIVEEKGYRLDELLSCETPDDVMVILDAQYETDRDPDTEQIEEDELAEREGIVASDDYDVERAREKAVEMEGETALGSIGEELDVPPVSTGEEQNVKEGYHSRSCGCGTHDLNQTDNVNGGNTEEIDDVMIIVDDSVADPDFIIVEDNNENQQCKG